MKTLLLFLALFACVFARADSSKAIAETNLKSAVAAWFQAETRIDQTASMTTVSAVIDGKINAKERASLRATWPQYSGQWRAGLLKLAKSGTDSPQDLTILADMRAAHRALEDSEKDRAKFDEALRRLKDLRVRVGG